MNALQLTPEALRNLRNLWIEHQRAEASFSWYQAALCDQLGIAKGELEGINLDTGEIRLKSPEDPPS